MGWINSAGTGSGRERPFRRSRAEDRIAIPAAEIFSSPLPRFGRMDRYTRLGVAGIGLALKDAGLEERTDTLRDIPTMASTVYGCLETDEAYYKTVLPQGGKLASPNLFAYTLSNTFLGEAAIQFGLSGAGFVLHESSLSGIRGLKLAFLAVSEGGYSASVTGVCDSGPRPGLGLTGRAAPGALFFVLQREKEASRPAYGALTRQTGGMIFFEGEEIRDLFHLAERCSERIP